jgi:heme a synthase
MSGASRIANWLLWVASLVFVMVIVGGITRLTESGLSITEWKPVTGALFPLNDAQWAVEFGKYKATPEYQQINAGMSLADFKFIYFWEWAHRLLGRLIGLAFALPFAWFALKRAIPKGYGLRLTVLLVLGGLQGVIGWWMVKSGLSLRTDVSHFRLAVHLLMALFIIALLIWTALDLRGLSTNPVARPARLTGFGAMVALVLFFQLLLGAWTAGLNAGTVANTWPMMLNGHFVPEGIDWSRGALFAFANDPYLIHWMHRWCAWIAVIALIMLARRIREMDRRASIAIHVAFGTQILLGIATVWTGVNISLAVLHQAVGALVVASVAWGLHVAGRRGEA